MAHGDDRSRRPTHDTKQQTWWTAAVLLCLLATMPASPAPAQSLPFRDVENVQEISRDPFGGMLGSQADTEVEPHVAVDPGDSQVVVALFQQGRFPDSGAIALGYATSHDGGRTWIRGSLPGLTTATGGPYERATDPVVAIGPSGEVYAASHAFTGSCDDAITISRSDDGGLTFASPIVVASEAACDLDYDKEWVTVDSHPASPHFGRVYVAWSAYDAAGSLPPAARRVPLLLRWSDDLGVTWSALRTVDAGGFTNAEGVIPLVQPNGDLTIVYSGHGPLVPRTMVAQTSRDGGETFDGPVVIATDLGVDIPWLRASVYLPPFGWNLPAANVDPVTGELWASWADGRFRPDGGNDIVLTRSRDGGATWDPVRVVSPHGRASFFTPAVAAFGGRLVITFHSTQESRDAVRTWFVSTGDGATFRRPRRLGRHADRDWAAQAGGRDFLGDYCGAAGAADAAYVVWARPSRPRVLSTAQHQTTWAARLE